MSTQGRRWWQRRTDEDFHAEIQAHLDIETDRLIGEGLDPDEARARATRAFGNRVAAEERFYERRRWVILEQFRQDLRDARRTLTQSPAFTTTTVATLAVALSLVTVLFGVFNAYVLRPFAIHDPSRVFQLAWQAPDGGDARFTWNEYQELAARTDLIDGAAAHVWQMVSSSDRQVHAGFVSGNYFDALRPSLRMGRALASFDAREAGASPVVVLSDQGWAILFNRDPHVIGRQLKLNGHAFEVIGVVRREFSGLDDAPLDLWVPLTMMPVLSSQDVFGPKQPRAITIFARLRRDVGPVQAGQALLPYFVRAAQAQAVGGRPILASDVLPDLRSRATPNPLTLELVAILSPIFVAFGLVLAAACANVSSVMLARALSRQRELAIRLSIGASRGRIVRQLLTEALLISLLAGLIGLALAGVALRSSHYVFFATVPASLGELARFVPLDLDIRVFLFALIVGASTTAACALMPALQATRMRLTDALRGHFGSEMRSSTLRNLLVIAQVTVSTILLVAAATIVRNGVTVAATDLGFDPRGIWSINERGDGSPRIPAAAEALAADPRISELAVTSRNPLFGMLDTIGVTPAEASDAPRSRGETSVSSYMFVSPEYFSLLRVPIVRGRTFLAAEAHAEASVAVISQRTATLLWPNTDPIGRTLRLVTGPDQQADQLAGYSELVVVGIAQDVVSSMIYEGVDASLIYLPTNRAGRHAGALLVRGREGVGVQRQALQQLVERVDVNRATFEILPLAEMVEIMLYPIRVASGIGSVLGIVALGLSVSGLYGLLMYVLGHRTREIGIRMALGATATNVVGLMMRQSARVVGVAIALGLVLAYSALVVLASIVTLRNVSVLNGWSFAIGIALIATAAAIATYFPARRAVAIDPCQTLRSET